MNNEHIIYLMNNDNLHNLKYHVIHLTCKTVGHRTDNLLHVLGSERKKKVADKRPTVNLNK